MKHKKFARIFIEGIIEKDNDTYNQEWLLDTIDEIADKKRIMGILVHIDSPGGGVYQTDEVYKALLAYKKKTKKPVYAYFGSLAASGGYYIGLAADKIFANRNTLTGSIGVISARFLDASALLGKVGIKSEYIHTGRNKTMGDIATPPTQEQIAIMQRISDESYEQFTGLVAERRKLGIEKVRELADGRIYSAKQALEAGLIDEIADFKEACDSIEKELGYSLTAIDYKRKKKGLLKKFLGPKNQSGVDAVLAKLKSPTPFPAFFFDPGRFR
ncbi:MAG: signal peptide peptidase SppA [Spirochaetales bacterium]|nr:signal peptide peptidase SppA [Spirochaetales bacterium]